MLAEIPPKSECCQEQDCSAMLLHCPSSAAMVVAAFDGGQLTREIILLRSPATAPENLLLACN
jgi:hypothetical protein